MAIKGTLVWICSLAAISVSVPQLTNHTECELMPTLRNVINVLHKHNVNAVNAAAPQHSNHTECKWSPQQSAELMFTLMNAFDALHKHQVKECQGAKPTKCPDPEVPENGGLVCVTLNNRRFCKPMCNSGYDFAFLRRSRLFDECSELTGYKWNTQYVGGNRLAVCNASPMQVSATSSAYFPKERNCLTSKSQILEGIIQSFTVELRGQDLEGEPENACLVCG